MTRWKPISLTTVTFEKGWSEGLCICKKTRLHPQKKKKRHEWVKTHKNWTNDDRNKFELFGSKLRVYVCRQTGERLKAPCVTPTIQHGGGSSWYGDVYQVME
ncbi:uncharacterized protein LOC116778268 [Xyrichtys novacula]|uniref:Uncharacterized protein LOC116778268 n=1 Tax=Xyrichtys novacula TaxID=13765 RepID=A0AAV1EMS8_XYRNO|nr:uncharacterized protein LOC116778268 [Xyrichtys novacula]